jgi:hypothetical protein
MRRSAYTLLYAVIRYLKGRFSAFVLEMELDQEDCSFKTLGQIVRKGAEWAQAPHILGDRMLVVQDSDPEENLPKSFFLWDYRTSRFCQWAVPRNNCFSRVSSMLFRSLHIDDLAKAVLTDEYILWITPESAYAWDISQLEMAPFSEGAFSQRPLVSPHWVVRGCWPFEQCQTLRVSALPLLRQRKTNSVSLEFAAPKAYSGKQMVARYQLTMTREPGGITGALEVVGASFLPQRESYVSEGDDCDGIWTVWPRKVDGNAVHAIPRYTAWVCACHPRETPSHDLGPDVVRELAATTPTMRTHLAPESRSILSCAFSGRILHAKWEETKPGGYRADRIYCSDYLS